MNILIKNVFINGCYIYYSIINKIVVHCKKCAVCNFILSSKKEQEKNDEMFPFYGMHFTVVGRVRAKHFL